MRIIWGIAIDKDLAERAKEHFGITANPDECGYILPDGSMLDFTGRCLAGDSYCKVPDGRFRAKKGFDFLAGIRSVDHRDLWEIFSEADTPSENMYKFMEATGAVRCKPESGGAEVVSMPSPAQIRTLAYFLMATVDRGEDSMVDVVDPNGRTDYGLVPYPPTVAKLTRLFREKL